MSMPGRETLIRILEKAVEAPSGDNSQPWVFSLKGDHLEIRNVETDATIYNYAQRGSYLSHGALAENISLLAAAEGYNAAVESFPQGTDCTARIRFEKQGDDKKFEPGLVEAIAKRTSNRKAYDKRDLSSDMQRALEEVSQIVPRITLGWITERERIEKLAPILSQNERLLFEHRGLHDFLFSMIRWTEQEETEKPGLYVMTMEFPAPLRFLIKHLFSHWLIVKAANSIGLSRAISGDTAKLYGTSSAFCAIIIDGYTDSDFFRAGRAFERIWLCATELGMSIQPVTALPYLLQRVREGQAGMFTGQQHALIQDLGQTIERTFAVPQGSHIAMLFRIGYAPPPTAHSKKLPPVIS